MFGLFGKRRTVRPERELRGLLSCIVAWRRAGLEAHLHDKVAQAPALEEKRELLRLYAEAAGGVDPLTTHVLGVPVGQLDQGLFLEALYRLETASSVAWALGLVPDLLPIETRADFKVLGALFPVESRPESQVAGAALRDRSLLKAQRDLWLAHSADACRQREGAANEESEYRFSRAYERARGLMWVCSDAGAIEDTLMPA